MRCLVFRDGDEIQLQSRSGALLTHDFPAVVEQLRALAAHRFVLDGNIIVADNHAMLMVFDLLVTERANLLVNRILVERRGTPGEFCRASLRRERRHRNLAAHE